MCEQLWAQLKPLASVTRYMAMPNYLDCIDDALGFVASSRMAGFVPFMVQQHKSNLRKLGEQHAAPRALREQRHVNIGMRHVKCGSCPQCMNWWLLHSSALACLPCLPFAVLCFVSSS